MPMSLHTLRAETFLPLPRDEVFAFFAAAENLERITPPELGFEIVTPAPFRMEEGALIEYRLRLFRISFRWRTIISRWDPPNSFVDEQLSGPYREWIHTHDFREVEGGTIVTDEVRYRLPFFPLGEIGYPLVALQLGRIFRFRRRRMAEILAGGG